MFSSKPFAGSKVDRTLKPSTADNVMKPTDLSSSLERGSRKLSMFGAKPTTTPSKSRASTLTVASATTTPVANKSAASGTAQGWNSCTKSAGFTQFEKEVYVAPPPRVKSTRTQPVVPKATQENIEPNENTFLSTIALTPPTSPEVSKCASVSVDEVSVAEQSQAAIDKAAALSAKKAARRATIQEEKMKEIQAIEETWTDVPSPMPTSSNDSTTASKSGVPMDQITQLTPFNYVPSDDEHEDEDDEDCEEEGDHNEEQPSELIDNNDTEDGNESVVTSTPVASRTPIKSPVKSRKPLVGKVSMFNSPQPVIPKHIKAATPSFKKKPSTPQQTALETPNKSLFKTGVTLAEEIAAQERSLRQYNETKTPTHGVKSAHKRPHKTSVLSKAEQLSPIFMRAGKGDFDGMGRPSIGTMTTQWEFMRTNFLNNSDEDLEWLMVSKKGGAYKYAHKKNGASEDKYFKSLHDIEKFEGKIQLLTGGNAKLPQGITEIAEKCKGLGNTTDPKLIEKLTTIHDALQVYCKATPAAVSAFSSKVEAAIQSFLEETDKQKVYRKARDLNDRVAAEIKGFQSSLIQARKDSDDALVNMEKWAKRERETDDYASEMRQEEIEWLAKEEGPNQEALRTMRRYVPPNISELSINELMSQANDEGGLFSLELATEIKNNRLLYWMVTHTDDIAVANFLSGDKKNYFENLEAYDIIELRALAVCIPSKFELDNDGKKAEWRSRMMTRVKQLVSQFNRDKVKGMWDEVLGRRQMVELPQLKPEQQRRLVYYYRTKEQSDVRLKQYDDKNALLAKKELLLKSAETEATDAKQEYDVVLKEMRDPDFVEEYGAEKLTAVKEMAKKDWTVADKKFKTLTQEVARLRKTIADAPLTRDQFYNMEKELERHLKFKLDFNWSEKGQSPVMIEGVFDPEPIIAKIERMAAKCISAEQEAAQRKAELTSLKVGTTTTKDDVSETVSSAFPSRAATPVEGISVAQEIATFDSAKPTEASVLFASPKAMKRNSVIMANPELANTLNKMFDKAAASNGSTSAVKSFRRNSVFATPSKKEGVESTEGTEVVEVKVKKVSQSRLLKKLTEPKEEAPKRPMGLPMGGMSFLDELKAKKAGISGATAGGPPAMSFLDELKAKKQANSAESASAAPKSFLDQIRGFKNKTEDNETPSEDVPPPVPKKSIMPAMPNLGFLDMIKARRID